MQQAFIRGTASEPRAYPLETWAGLLIHYWLLFAYFAAGALHESGTRPRVGGLTPFLALGGVLIAILVGLRYMVGADWASYQFMFAYMRHADLARALEIGDPAYQLLNWTVRELGGELWLVNLVCGTIFAWGLLRFALAQPRPWLVVLVAIPYMVVVVAMGYSRQAVALGILMAGLSTVGRGNSVLRFAAYVGAAALFHKTAVVALPLIALGAPRNRLINSLLVLATAIFFYDVFLGDEMQNFVKNYIDEEYSSQGAVVRVVMSVVPALIFFSSKDLLTFSAEEWAIWRNFSVATLLCFVFLIVSPSSTAVDRIALYLIPLQLAVLSRIPGTTLSELAGKMTIVAYSTLVLFVWLNFAAHAKYWLPYQFYPFD